MKIIGIDIGTTTINTFAKIKSIFLDQWRDKAIFNRACE